MPPAPQARTKRGLALARPNFTRPAGVVLEGHKPAGRPWKTLHGGSSPCFPVALFKEVKPPLQPGERELSSL